MVYCTWRSYKLKAPVFKIFSSFKEEKNCCFLDSSLNSSCLGRFSFLAFDPFYILSVKDEDPFVKLRALLSEYRMMRPKIKLPFLGGAVGYLSYDLGFILEDRVTKRPKIEPGVPDVFFAFYNTVIIADHFKNKLYLFAVGFPEKRYSSAKLLCRANLRKIERRLAGLALDKDQVGSFHEGGALLRSNFSQREYIAGVEKAKAYIKAGDIYQVNLSQRFNACSSLSAFQIYERLRSKSPAYFSAYLDAGEFQILSSSPERFLKVEGDKVVTRPMKGTRPRGKDRARDIRLRQELMQSAKDKAELTMIVDLERNDLGKVCNYDSVKVSALRNLERYRTVYQTTATIEGRLYRDKDRIDLLRACFPGGSITGCPKIRAMEIIEELEPHRRSIYTGALGYLSFCGKMDFNILIRTILKKKKEISFDVGAGIVADSEPLAEYEETLVKAKAMMEAIQ